MSISKERKEERLHSGLPDTMEPGIYNLTIGGCLLYGFGVNALMVKLFSGFFGRMDPTVFMIAYVICVIAGVLISRSTNALASFVGYNLIVIPIGAVLAVALPNYESGLVFEAMAITAVITGVLMALATVFPHWFSGLGRVLGICLLVLFITSILSALIGFSVHFLVYISAGLFTLYIGYDWYKAQAYPKTLDNAVDSALDLYLDIINLFLDILKILAKAKSRD